MSSAHWLLPVAAVAALICAPTAWAGDPEHGLIVSARCAACHGVRGETDDPMIPRLAGQNGMYLFMQLKNFKEGARSNGLMTPQARALSTEDMDDVATYFAAIKLPRTPPAPGVEMVQPPQMVSPQTAENQEKAAEHQNQQAKH